MVVDEEALRTKLAVVFPHLDERQLRILAGAEARATVHRAVAQVDQGVEASDPPGALAPGGCVSPTRTGPCWRTWRPWSIRRPGAILPRDASESTRLLDSRTKVRFTRHPAHGDGIMDITGSWYNELGSTFDILLVSDGRLQGAYETAVSSTGCASGAFIAVGTTDTDRGENSVGWSVVWVNDKSNCRSVTTWSGQVVGEDADGEILTTWLLTMATDAEDAWASTLVGTDVFRRTPPTEEEVTRALQRQRHSHP